MEGNWCYAGAKRIRAGQVKRGVARVALEHGLKEFAAGIPGSVGSLVMNAGAYGSEIKNILKSARVMTNEGEVLELSRDELILHQLSRGLGYCDQAVSLRRQGIYGSWRHPFSWNRGTGRPLRPG